MMARATIEPLDVAGAFTSSRDCKHFRYATTIDQLLALRGESTYDGLGVRPLGAQIGSMPEALIVDCVDGARSAAKSAFAASALAAPTCRAAE